MAKLVIVESPAKAKTIGKYLGDDYEVTASMGHIRDLPASQLGIDVEHGYTPQYISIKGKEKLIKELKSKAKHADGVLLATDPDREGEAISWHLANILGLDPHAPNRVTFDEITKKGVKEGMAHPRAIDEDLFNAQQARRVLDRLVGYKLSPFLWRKVRRGLSAGRVQSVAVRLIRDRELEIENFKPDEYWNLDALLSAAGDKSEFTARLAATADGKKLTVTDIVNECHITRQTFYYHFEDIPDLLLWMMKRNLKRNMQEASMQSTPEESLKYLITLSLSSRLFVEKAMHAGYREELERLVMQSFNSLIERILRRGHFPPGCTREQMSLMLRYHLNAVVGLMRSWTEEDSAHIDETVRDIYRMMAASMNAFAPGGATRLPEKLKD